MSLHGFRLAGSAGAYAYASVVATTSDFRIDVVYDAVLLEKHIALMEKHEAALESNRAAAMMVLGAMYLAASQDE